MSYPAPPTNPMNQPPTNPQPPYPPRPPYPQAQPPKKNNTLKFVLLGCGGFLLVGIIAVGVIGYFAYNKVKSVYDPELAKRNPELATALAVVRLNPELELISYDEAKNTVTVKSKKDNKVVTMTFTKDANGQVVLKTSENGKESSIKVQGDGENGSVEIKGADGSTAKFGSGAGGKVPDWVPVYPGVEMKGTYSTENGESEGKGFSFDTRDSIQEVMDFYEKALKDEGFKVTTTKTNQNGQDGGSVSGNDANYKRFVVVGIYITGGKTTVSVTSQLNKK